MLLTYFKNSQKRNQKNQGYTIIEVAVAQIMVGILATMSLPNLFSQVEHSRQAEAKTFLGTMNKLQQVYYAENSTLADSVEKLGVTPKNTNNFDYSVEYQNNQALHHGNYKNNAKYNLVSAVCINNSLLTIIPPQENVNQVIDCTLLTNNNSSPINNNSLNNNPNNNNTNNGDTYQTVTGGNLLNNDDNIILIGDSDLDDNDQDKKDKDKDKDKVTVCHNGKEITISKAALKAHLAHGDSIGQCN